MKSTSTSTARAGYPAEWLSRDEKKRIIARSLPRALALYVTHLAFYFATLYAILQPWPWWVSLPFCLLNGLAIGLLFVLGHEAAHRTLVPGKRLNDWLARIAFIFPAHSRAVWVVAHNSNHHRFTNLLHKDGVWEPMTLQAYQNASRWRRAYERFERSPLGGLTFYYWGILFTRAGLPLRMNTPNKWRRFGPDIAFMVLGVVTLITLIAGLGNYLDPSRPLAQAIFLGWMLPFILGLWFISVSIYLNHTHPDIIWFDKAEDWSYYGAQIKGSTDVIMPWVLRKAFPLYQDVMAHTAHHGFVNVPIYNLPEAQAAIVRRYGRDVVRYNFSLHRYLDIVRRCKLIDTERKCWVDFNGVPTSEPQQQHYLLDPEN